MANKNKKRNFKNKIIKGTTKSGFNYQIDPDIFFDMEFWDKMAETDDNPFLLPKVISIALGEEQKENLYNFCRDKSGKVPINKVVGVIKEIFANDQVKNSLSLPRF